MAEGVVSQQSDAKPCVRLGVCCMDGKSQSAPMRAILRRLERYGDFHIIIFGEETILNKNVEDWPIVECLISFYSDGFPLDRAIEYVNLREPLEINELKYQRVLRHRSIMYELLRTIEVACPAAIYVDHNDIDNEFFESEDYIIVKGTKITKPFVEKPVDADDHNIWIYYPRSFGGGIKKLFRKVGDKSSMYVPNERCVRRSGKFLYEPFISTQGTDIKVYTVGPTYFHAEARKAPTVDGKVNRSKDGKEIRYPIILSTEEKRFAAAIVQSFGQKICGFDILRTTKGTSIVCDVNGWSFVKGNQKYYNDCAILVRAFFLRALEEKMQPGLIPQIPSELWEPNLDTDIGEDEYDEVIKQTFADADGDELSSEGLKAVIVIMRHGDRKPKEKLKFKCSHPDMLRYLDKNPKGKDKEKDEVVIKSVDQMGDLLRRVDMIIQGFNEELNTSSLNSTDSAKLKKSGRRTAVLQDRGNMELVRDVLMLHDKFTGINRKVQLKPLRWDADGKATQCRVVAKWGGEITKMGREQAEDLGRRLRVSLYPNDRLLRLHSTFRHDFKIYSSSEGRCQTTAAAFTKGFLDLEGELTPILISLVTINEAAKTLLDEPIPREKRDSVKDHIDYLLHMTDDADTDIRRRKSLDHEKCQLEQQHFPKTCPPSPVMKNHSRIMVPTGHPGLLECAALIGSPLDTQWKLMKLMETFIDAVSTSLASRAMEEGSDSGSLSDEGTGAVGGLSRFCSTDLEPRGPGPRMPRNDGDGHVRKVAQMWRLEHRWRKLFWGFVQLRKGVNKQKIPGVQEFTQSSECTHEKVYFDTSKIPDIWDNIFFDLTHRREELEIMGCVSQAEAIYDIVNSLNSWVTVAEFGITKEDKLRIGAEVTYRLLNKILGDLEFMFERERPVSRNSSLNNTGMCDAVSEASMSLPVVSIAYTDQQAMNLPDLTAASTAGDSSVDRDRGTRGTDFIDDVCSADHDHDKRTSSIQSGKRVKKTKKPGKTHWTSEEWHPVRADDVKTESVRSRVYVTSASSMHSLLNVLCHAPGDMVDDEVLGDIVDLGYMSHIVMRCFQDDGPEEELSGYRCEVLVSEGVVVTDDDGAVRWPMGNQVTNKNQQVAPLKRLLNVPLDELHDVVSTILGQEEYSGIDSDD